MSTQPITTNHTRDFAETLADELTSAAYAVVLEHKGSGSWLELELDLWRAVSESLRSTQAERAGIA